MSDSGPSDGTLPVDETLIRELARLRDAGNALAEAAHRVSSDGDGIHRLRLAMAGWYEALANEFERDKPKLLTEIAAETELPDMGHRSRYSST